MGASLADQNHRAFKLAVDKRLLFIAAGAGAGFGAAIGTPWAGVIFGMDMIQIGRLKLFAWYECLIASFISYYTVLILQAPHSQFSLVSIAPFKFQSLYWFVLAGFAFGIAARVFILISHFVEFISKKYISQPAFRPMIFGFILVGLYQLEGTFQYVSLGIPIINEALTTQSTIKYPILKVIFTALTVGSGFKGGEFVPLVFIGTTLGSALGNWVPVSFSLLGAVGFTAVFAGAANIPITCTIMAIELFGWPIAPYALIACFASYYVSGHKGIYKTQRIFSEKPKVPFEPE